MFPQIPNGWWDLVRKGKDGEHLQGAGGPHHRNENASRSFEGQASAVEGDRERRGGPGDEPAVGVCTHRLGLGLLAFSSAQSERTQ